MKFDAPKLAAVAALSVATAGVTVALYRAGVTRYSRENASVADLVHFTVVTQYTVGYGDIYPVNTAARILSWIHMFVFFAIVVAR